MCIKRNKPWWHSLSFVTSRKNKNHVLIKLVVLTQIYNVFLKIGRHKWIGCKCCKRKLGMLSYKFIKHVLMTHLITYPFVKNDYNDGIWNTETSSKQLTKCAKFKTSKLITHKDKEVQIDKHGCFLIVLYLIITTNKKAWP
jgi:hypothetical protein